MTNDKAITITNEQSVDMEPLSAKIILERMAIVQATTKTAMQDKVHYGKVPGTDKPVLLKPGAEILCTQFMLSPEITTNVISLQGEHREYVSVCTLRHSPSGRTLAKLSGSASTMEKKYRYRIKKLICPQCSQPTVFKDKKVEGRYYCWAKEGGCGANYQDDPRITDQPTGREDNPSLADVWNTVRKMAEKRALVAAVLVGTGCSSIFTQDLEDQRDYDGWAKAEAKREKSNGLSTVKEQWKMTGPETLAFEKMFDLQWDMPFDADVFKAKDYDDDCIAWCRDAWKKIENGELVLDSKKQILVPAKK